MLRHFQTRWSRSGRYTAAFCLLLLLSSVATPGFTAPLTEHRIDLQRVPLRSAISQLSLQTGVPIGVDPRAQDVMVGPLAGTYTITEAFRLLLRNTGLKYEKVDEFLFAVKPENSAAQTHPSQSAARPVSAHARRAPKESLAGDQILVTATPLPPPQISGTVVSMDREQLERLGASSIPDALEYLTSQPFTMSEGYRSDGGQYADLRGLGPDAVTVLIDGRWVPPGAISGAGFDLNLIPITAVERVEVWLDPSTATIGARSIGGVINIVLKKKDSPPTVRIEYGSADGGAAQRRISLGSTINVGRLQGALSLDRFERDELSGAKRSLWLDQDYRRFGGGDWRSIASQPGNISSSSSAPLPGLHSSYAAVPAGSSGVGLTPQDFAASQGSANFTSLRRFVSVVPAADRTSAAGTFELAFEPLTAFGEMFYSRTTTVFEYNPPTLNGERVPETNAFNPFGAPVGASVMLTAFGPQRTITDTELARGVTGARGQINSWSWELSALQSREVARSVTKNQLDPERVATALAQSDPALALNVFQDGPGGSPEQLASLLDEDPTNVYSSMGTQASGWISGPLFELPAGEARSVIGAQWRKEDMAVNGNALNRTVATALAEVSVPLLNSLDASLGWRLDHFSDLGSIFTPNYALHWMPVADLRFRASYGASFQAPTAYELFGPRYAVQLLAVDPRRDELASVSAWVGSSPQLETVRGRSLTASVAFTPHQVRSLSLSAGYWVKLVSNRITRLPISLLIEHEQYFVDRVMRDAPTDEDLQAGLPGRLRSLDLSPLNFGTLRTSGIDASVACELETRLGTFTPSLSATWIDEFVTLDAPGGPAIDRVGLADTRGTIPRWRAVAAIDWRKQYAGLSVAARYTAPYDDTNGIERTGRRIPAQTLIDVRASLDFGALIGVAGGWDDVTLTGGVLNVFDVEPAFAEVGFDAGFDMSQGTLKKRYGYLRLSKQF